MADTLGAGGLETILPKGFENSLDTQRDADAVAKLKAACLSAYESHPHSCSHAVNAVIRQVMDLDEGAWPQRQANALVAFLVDSADWTKVTLDRGYELAQQGVVVVGGKEEKIGNGHVVVIFPGPKAPRGGYSFTDKQGNKQKVASKGLYPLVLSTSIGAWPGAKSKSDKTVWDPWGKDTAFAEVRFWAPTPFAAGKPNVSASLRRHGGLPLS
ncbi:MULTISPECIES: hypothetical protein [Roseomonadaceae]|uniref:Uncharacterized protein n=1 Tax=Falsiroseomonas oleicola TaxID=2801474 RepID=A0ABS6H4J9_9PROT|nr:hypothetical protein [Roseomonas oleicola]MBU8542426.1 hypothetical protein [Roseomonas oleicola]